MKIVDIGGAQELRNVLVYAKDELTLKEALKALNALSKSVQFNYMKMQTSTFCFADEAVKALRNARAISVIMSILDTFVDAEIGTYKAELLKRF
ncbi:ARM repeat superfamily protein [Gossypium australe]|uniref:ARM repeat superfamily protein n=1 Tax=Gossypium australe TaxID=47621 RepID=A0A5B6WJY9_9ROSI|nr:ARM repeat superfamily protein [Gossypium australe]